jgi:putative transposase
MKDTYPNFSLVRFCRLFGVTRQSYYKHFWQWEATTIEHEIIIRRVKEIRQNHPVLGGRKLYALLQPDLLQHQIKLGRDGLFDLLAAHSLLIRRKRRRAVTTHSNHWYRKYPNLIKGLESTTANKLWVSDITYWRTPFGFLYISFITDAYSHKIVGYHLADNLEAVNNVKALQMALSGLTSKIEGLIHHSDRGIQYCCMEYVNMLRDHQIKISMTESGDPLENPIAERINGIIKEEYLKHNNVLDKSMAYEVLSRSIQLYNNERPHLSTNLMTPKQAHHLTGKLNKQWKNYYHKKTSVNQL